MRTNAQEAVLSAYIASIGKRTPRDAAQDAAELCRLATSLNRSNEIACNSGLTERQERRKQNLQTRIKAMLEQAGLDLNHFNSDPRGYAVYLDLPDGSYNSGRIEKPRVEGAPCLRKRTARPRFLPRSRGALRVFC